MLGQLLGALGTWCSQVWARWGCQTSVVLELDESPLPEAGAAPGRHFLLSSQLLSSPSLPLPQAWAGELSPRAVTPTFTSASVPAPATGPLVAGSSILLPQGVGVSLLPLQISCGVVMPVELLS